MTGQKQIVEATNTRACSCHVHSMSRIHSNQQPSSCIQAVVMAFSSPRGLWENVRSFNPRLRFCVCSKWRLANAHQFQSFGQDQSTVAQRAETTVAERSQTYTRTSNKCHAYLQPPCHTHTHTHTHTYTQTNDTHTRRQPLKHQGCWGS